MVCVFTSISSLCVCSDEMFLGALCKQYMLQSDKNATCYKENETHIRK